MFHHLPRWLAIALFIAMAAAIAIPCILIDGSLVFMRDTGEALRAIRKYSLPSSK